MDRNTVVGLVLIGLILAVFTIFNKPSEEELNEKKELAKKELEQQRKEKAKKAPKDTIEMSDAFTPKLDSNGVQLTDSTGALIYVDTLTNNDTILAAPANTTSTEPTPPPAIEGEIVRLESDKLIVDFDTKGGQVASVRLKEFETFHEFSKNDDKDVALTLFKKGDASNGLTFSMGENIINTTNELFTVKSKTDSKIVFELKKGADQSLEFSYELTDGQYDLGFDIDWYGFEGKVNPKDVMFNWDVSYRKTERLFSEQRRVSTVCFDYKDEGFSYLSETTTDDEEAEDDVNWVCFKQSYFSSFIQPETPFDKLGSTLSITSYGDGEAKKNTHLKDYSASMNLGLKKMKNASVHMNWFFGPNDYEVLTTYDAGYEDILNYGWGVFRWINLYAIQPLFNLFKSTGLTVGIIILLMTLIIKFALMPIQWKMYTSSAKMRILKPEIDEINQKYPNKEDGMKKQMEVMSLYRESGASPLAGCVPMLIQMPILLAVFRFFPATFGLRQESFLWAQDLSSYDSIWDFGVYIWPYGDHVSLFTLLMAITTLIYTFINSGNMQTQQQPGMPNMKYIMYFFPIMMIFFFNNYSSGLSYYYFISTLMSIIIMLLIKKFFVDEDKIKEKMANRKAATAAAGGSGKKTKSKFQERLEQMQKAQMEQAKRKKK